MELVASLKHKVWGWPAAANFALGGMAAGCYLLTVVMGCDTEDVPNMLQSEWKVLPPVVVGLCFLGMAFEAGRPLRSKYVLNNLRSSWMSREILAGGMFVLTAVLDWFFPHVVFRTLAATGALGLIMSQGFILYRARAVTSWNVRLVPIHFLTSSLSTGFGLVLLLAVHNTVILDGHSLMIGLICLLLNLAIWLTYLRGYCDAPFRNATEVLRHPSSLFLTVGIGHLIPGLLVGLLFLGWSIDIGVGLQQTMFVPAGLAIVAGGVAQKFTIVCRTNYLRGITIEEPISTSVSGIPRNFAK